MVFYIDASSNCIKVLFVIICSHLICLFSCGQRALCQRVAISGHIRFISNLAPFILGNTWYSCFCSSLHSFLVLAFGRGKLKKVCADIASFTIRQPSCLVFGRRPQHAVSKLACHVLSSARSCRSIICPDRLSTAWLVSIVVFSCRMVSKW